MTVENVSLVLMCALLAGCPWIAPADRPGQGNSIDPLVVEEPAGERVPADPADDGTDGTDGTDDTDDDGGTTDEAPGPQATGDTAPPDDDDGEQDEDDEEGDGV